MKTIAAALVVLFGSAVATGQQPAAPAPLTPAQAAAVSGANVNAALPPLIQAAAAAQAALLEASLAQPVNQADLRTRW